MSDERTIKASERRRKEAREDGRSPHSTAFVNGVQLLVIAFLVSVLGESLVASLASFTKQSLIGASLELAAPQDLFQRTLVWSSEHLATWLVAILLTAIVANVIQLGGLRLLIHRIMPDFGRVNPGSGLSRLFGGQNFTAGMQSLVMVVAVLSGIGLFWWSLLPKVLSLSAFNAGQILISIVRFGSTAALLLATILVVLGVMDFGLSWWKFERGLMMTPEELREELRDTQGNPQIKARRTEQARAVR
jgi:flagellar biosynthesis protein FlhB